MINDSTTLPEFEVFGLNSALLRAVNNLGYEKPTSIQEQVIFPLLAGQDVMGQAQTGTGKTAAFALPFLNDLDVKSGKLQVIVLTPTRELCIQVSEHIGLFAKFMDGVKILPVYGGADMRSQLRALNGGVHIVVGTPGRVMDHMRRGTLKLDTLTTIVLDEADEMLNMGFQEDVEWILEQAPENRRMSIFSATIPPAIRRIAKKFMHDPLEITVNTKTTTAATIHQRYWIVSGLHKLDALARILEAEDYDGVIVFVRTRAETVELAQKLEERGFNAAPLNGDIPQHMREQTVDRLKAKRIDILVATDVAARGLDVERISHVINYDAPHDAEAYIHRVGRTGRAGRNGEAILFLSSKDRGMLHVIERATRQKIDELEMPKTSHINEQRIVSFKQKITDKIANGKLDLFRKIVQELTIDSDLDPLDIAAAAACMSQGDKPLLLLERDIPVRNVRNVGKDFQIKSNSKDYSSGKKTRKGKPGEDRFTDIKMIKYRVEVGLTHGLKAGNLLGAIANEAGLDGKHVGRIMISDDFSTVDLPVGMPSDILQELKKVRVVGQQLRISLDSNQYKSRDGKKDVDSRKQRKLTRAHRGGI